MADCHNHSQHYRLGEVQGDGPTTKAVKLSLFIDTTLLSLIGKLRKYSHYRKRSDMLNKNTSGAKKM